MIIQIDKTPAQPRWKPAGTLTDGSGADDVFHVQFDPAEESVVAVVVRSVATIKNVDPLDLEPLGATIDPSTLKPLVDSESSEPLHGAEITFEYAGLHVTIDTDGHLWLEWA